MNQATDPSRKEKAKSAENRPVGPAASHLDKKQKKLLNLHEESQHQSGEDKLASEEAAGELDRNKE